MNIVSSRQIYERLIPHVDSGELPGFCAVVSNNGHTVVASGGYSDLELKKTMDAESLFRLASLTKPLTAVLTLQAVEMGDITLDTELAELVPELANPRVLTNPRARFQTTLDSTGNPRYEVETEALKRPITVYDLLTMTSGYGFWVGTSLAAAYKTANINFGIQHHYSRADFIRLIGQMPLCFQPGDGWAYNWSVEVLGVALQRATGIPMETLMEERIRRPLGLKNLSYTMNSLAHATSMYKASPSGPVLLDPREGDYSREPKYYSARTGLVTTAPEYLRILDDLSSEDPILLSPESAELMRTPALNEHQLKNKFFEPNANFGMFVQVADGTGVLPEGSYGWSGISGVKAYSDPHTGTSFGLFTQMSTITTRPQPWFNDFWHLLFD
ncbi:serine hydrolase domain-containing protein [Boudabousia marimammalium]|uniref:Beta-lactamase-related domain-containing protein n=1 Tax=Boudabousia marimammalium TaxID=156892 RepID=A0A1Q5PRY5_9ACTO|nr:serine hydrolase domain-containing protein [Boudabousia marimammalium]OKL50293.1 hypothetical protein BM477_02580 [Boudabousia marimammalium]